MRRHRQSHLARYTKLSLLPVDADDPIEDFDAPQPLPCNDRDRTVQRQHASGHRPRPVPVLLPAPANFSFANLAHGSVVRTQPTTPVRSNRSLTSTPSSRRYQSPSSAHSHSQSLFPLSSVAFSPSKAAFIERSPFLAKLLPLATQAQSPLQPATPTPESPPSSASSLSSLSSPRTPQSQSQSQYLGSVSNQRQLSVEHDDDTIQSPSPPPPPFSLFATLTTPKWRRAHGGQPHAKPKLSPWRGVIHIEEEDLYNLTPSQSQSSFLSQSSAVLRTSTHNSCSNAESVLPVSGPIGLMSDTADVTGTESESVLLSEDLNTELPIFSLAPTQPQPRPQPQQQWQLRPLSPTFDSLDDDDDAPLVEAEENWSSSRSLFSDGPTTRAAKRRRQR